MKKRININSAKRLLSKRIGITFNKKLLWNVENHPFPVLNVPTLNLIIKEKANALGEEGTILEIIERHYGQEVKDAYLAILPSVQVLHEQEGEITNDYWHYDPIWENFKKEDEGIR
ncbi:MAG: hypothetical protein NZ455_03405 [Bacteroidia bacterium]|nr:hypothetical protein [Bacteroidia bacterium]